MYGLKMNYTLTVYLLLFLPISALAQPWPPEAPQKWGIAILDVETTGLDPAYHEMIDLGLIYTDLEGNELGRFFTRINPDHPERIGDIARSINGFDTARWDSLEAMDEQGAVRDFLAFHENHKGARTWVVLAYNAYFDRGFLDAFLQQHGSSFRELYTYFVLDLPSMAWGAGITDLRNADVAQKLGLEPETDDPLRHTGMSGAEFNLAMYKALLAQQKITQ